MTGERFSRLALVFVSMVVAALLAAQPLSAGELTSVVTDPVGDAGASINGQGIAVFAYQDIVQASITLRDGRFILVMDVAAPIPSGPALPNGVKLLEWSFRLDTNLTTAPCGFPFEPADCEHHAEYMVFILWDGTSFTGILIDRTPLLTGGQAVITRIPFNINGAEITASVDAVMIGNPPSFHWVSRTEDWSTQLGTSGFVIVDFAPEEGTFAIWPS